MTLKKGKSNGLASLLIQDRFFGAHVTKKRISRSSTTEFGSISMLDEILTVENRTVSNTKEHGDRVSEIDVKYGDIIFGMNYDLSVPPRIPYTAIETGEYRAVELSAFNRWKCLKSGSIFERNLEVWRQFWLTCERSTTIAQIIDSRNPCAYFNDDILKMYPHKTHVLFLNKTDLVESIEKSIQKLVEMRGDLCGISSIYAYSTKESRFDFALSGTVGLIGYPNVGKSSTINLILSQKKVRVSSTPGKTKSIQTIETPEFTLLDCPGLVFPSHSKIDLVLMGILNIDQVQDLQKHERDILGFIGVEKLKKFYGVPEYNGDFLTAMSIHKGWVKSRCLKSLTKSFIAGEIGYF